MAERIIGIDLGTSNSAAAIIQGGKPTIIPSAEGQTAHGKAFPSVVAFPKDGSPMLVGTPAVNQAVTNPENTITKAKRKMGTDHVYKIQGKEYKPQQISAFILQKIKKDAEAFTGDKIIKAVITVPAYFDDNQCNRMYLDHISFHPSIPQNTFLRQLKSMFLDHVFYHP